MLAPCLKIQVKNDNWISKLSVAVCNNAVVHYRASQFKSQLPAVIVRKYGDDIQSHVVYEGKFTVSDVLEFIRDNKLPKLVSAMNGKYSCFTV